MKTCLSGLLIFFGFFANAVPTETVGRFVKIDWGDYQHLTIESGGKNIDFWCVNSKPISCSDLEKSPQLYKGKTLRIKHDVVEVFVPEVRKKVPQDQAISISLAN